MGDINSIPEDIKQSCVSRHAGGHTARHIYDSFFTQHHAGMSLTSFQRKLRVWAKRYKADALDTSQAATLMSCGRVDGMVAQGATVQVDKDGNIVQLWSKQSAGDDIDRLISHIDGVINPIDYSLVPSYTPSEGLLDIQLADMHLGVSTLEHYSPRLAKLHNFINSKRWDVINICVGGDLFHCDGFNGKTVHGTVVEPINLPYAWTWAEQIYKTMIDAAIGQAKTVCVRYIPGNHDRSMAWAFCRELSALYPDLVDTDVKYRKAMVYGDCFVGWSHADGQKGGAKDLRGQFLADYPVEFSISKVREVHCEHLHHEKEEDIYGCRVRRLGSAKDVDNYHDENGFIGALKRHEIFEWSKEGLERIHFI